MTQPIPSGGRLAGRVAVVTGASSGIGRATAIALAREGARVHALARRAAVLATLNVPGVSGIVADVTDPEGMQAVAGAIDRADLIVINAGTIETAPPAERWRTVMAVNLDGAMHTARAFLPGLRAAAGQGHPADLVLVSSNAVREVTPGRSAYHATKAAVSMLGACWRVDLEPAGVRVTTIEPGMVATGLVEQPSEPDERARLRAYAESVEALHPDDVADLIAYAVTRRPGVNVAQVAILPTHQV